MGETLMLASKQDTVAHDCTVAGVAAVSTLGLAAAAYYLLKGRKGATDDSFQRV